MSKRPDFHIEHHELQAPLARELQTYPASPMDPDEADAVAWHLADVVLSVVIDAVTRYAHP